MAHRHGIAEFLSIPVNKVPMDTDNVTNPKEHLVNLARISRSSGIRRDIVPKPGSTSRVGPDYNGRFVEFVMKHWEVEVALKSSRSLERTLNRLKSFDPKF